MNGIVRDWNCETKVKKEKWRKIMDKKTDEGEK